MKVLVSGTVEGSKGLEDLHVKATKLHASTHGPFDLLFASLKLTASSTESNELQLYIDKKSFPLPLYFILAPGCSTQAIALLKNGDLGGNIFFLGSGCAINDVRGNSIPRDLWNVV